MRDQVVLTYGKEWSNLMVKDRSAFHKIYTLGTPGFCLPAKDFERIAQKDGLSEGHAQSVWQMLSESSSVASTVVNRINFYVKNSDIVLIDTDHLDTAVGHEIVRTAYDAKKPCYAVGVSSNSSAIAPYYLAGIWYPDTTADIWKLVDLAVPRFGSPEGGKNALELGGDLREREKIIRKSDAVATL